MLEDVRVEVSGLVVAATRAVLADIATPKISEELVEKAIHTIQSR
jgi:hypothetical protein